MKKLLFAVLAVLLLISSLTACHANGANEPNAGTDTIEAAVTDTFTNEDVIAIFKDVFSSKREVFDAVYFSMESYEHAPLALMTDYSKRLCDVPDLKLAYIDVDGDGYVEALIGCDGYYLLHYDKETNRVYAYHFTPRGGCVFFENGEYWHNADGAVMQRYRITGFENGIPQSTEVTYTDAKPTTAFPVWQELALIAP